MSTPPIGVSIIIPVYNQHPWMIQQAIDTSLAQNGNIDIEVIVVDDGSTTSWENHVDLTHPKVKFFTYKENKGAGYTWDYGIQKSTKEYICPMACDDYFHLDKTELQMIYMKEKKVDFSYTAYRELFLNSAYAINGVKEHSVFNAPNNYGKTFFQELIRNDYGNNFINGASVMMTRKLYDDIGGYDVTMRFKNDYDLWLRIADKYNMCGIPHCLMVRRIHNNQAKYHFEDKKEYSERWLRTIEYITVKKKWQDNIMPITNAGVSKEILQQLGYQI